MVLLLACGAAAQTTPPSLSAPALYTGEDSGFRPGGDTALSLHKLNYAVMGKDGLKLQYSFKYRIVDRAPVFVAYTNTLLWRVFEPSIPAKDSVFNPELFYRVKEEKSWFVTFDAGYYHLSNGRGDPESRSIDRAFLRFQKSDLWERRPVHFMVQVFPLILAKGNFTLDYPHYVGWWEASVWLRNVLGQRRAGLDLQFQRTSGRWGHPFQRGSNVVGLQYRLEAWPRVNPLFYVQWFNGYGEVLIDYFRPVNRVRGGISWFY